jgi:adenylate cyclase
MQEKVARLREQWSKRGELAIQIRIGVSSGVVVVGNMGSARRLSYTVIGSVVNLAQRLESQAATGGILISKRTYELLDGDVDVEPVGPMTLRGVVEPVEVYRVGGLDHRVSVEEPREVRDAKKSTDS